MNHEEIIAMAREEGLSFVPDTNSPLARIVRKAVAKEREACARIAAGQWTNVAEKLYGIECAAAIRARGQKEGLV